MNRKTVKKWIIIAILIVLVVALISSTYSRYISDGSGSQTAEVAQWAIQINATDITPTGATTFPIVFHEVENDDVVDGKIAPASELYADFIVNPAGSEVAVDYEFELGSITPAITDLAIDRVMVTEGTTYAGDASATTLTAISGKYKGTIALASQSTALTASNGVVVRVYLKWTNNETNNTAHTASGIAGTEFSLTVTGTASQHIS